MQELNIHCTKGYYLVVFCYLFAALHYVGCYADRKERDLSHGPITMTPVNSKDRCAAICRKKGNQFLNCISISTFP